MPAVDPHYLWAAGHSTVLAATAYILLQALFFRGTPARTYRLAYTGALLSYSIVVYKSLGRPQASQAWLRRALVDENCQYALLALFWWVAKPVNITVLPFATFSLFHCLTFLRTNIIPKLVPAPAAPAGAAGAAGAQPARPPVFLETLSRKIQVWVKSNYDTAMRFVAYTEIAIIFRLLAGVLTLRTSFVTLIFMVHFVRLRYHASPFTRGAITNITGRIDGFAAGKGPGVQNAWSTAKRFIGSWGGMPLLPGEPAAAQAQGPGAQAAAARR
ncbi:endoplasmic reticulum protein [Cryptococcus wingfieldii CBS 7118]|uniref:Endoplasmic reticulum protein n=1 Tax=Cryptococcus wingfieldii CBS 7118 TaxID=1295528 RepID=A0A1E3K416_9TREE|nr:endoplasmic reticulum protein [Cryptococcus wingfieldii CBS 7118]ODO07287.1 endoplasmic reticulum protein [Cryptococcus wingfieldii CBS 7118]